MCGWGSVFSGCCSLAAVSLCLQCHVLQPNQQEPLRRQQLKNTGTWCTAKLFLPEDQDFPRWEVAGVLSSCRKTNTSTLNRDGRARDGTETSTRRAGKKHRALGYLQTRRRSRLGAVESLLANPTWQGLCVHLQPCPPSPGHLAVCAY